MATLPCIVLVSLGLLSASLPAGEALSRLQLDRLKAVHDAVGALQAERRATSQASGYNDVRALLHVHSSLSHDSRGTIEQILTAARATDVRVIMFSEHPAPHYDYFSDGYSGVHDGVLLVPGAETSGLLVFPTRSLKTEKTISPQQFTDLVRADDGLVFLSHLEERMDWDIAGLTGLEIYNTHADVKDEQELLAALRNPLLLFGLLPAMRQYPQEAFAALQDYPADYLKRWDELCEKSRLTGVAANDSHQNQAVVFRLMDDGNTRMEDALGKKIAELDPGKLEFLRPLVADKKPGEVVFEQYLDRYEHSFRYVSTHLLVKELSREQVWDALKRGRAYVAFDWIADPTGFVFQGVRASHRIPMGAEAGTPPLSLQVESPLPGRIRLLHNGQVEQETTGHTLNASVDRAGVYRAEVWLNVAGEQRPWILTNPIYVRDAE